MGVADTMTATALPVPLLQPDHGRPMGLWYMSWRKHTPHMPVFLRSGNMLARPLARRALMSLHIANFAF
jgi:hypothetical protein